jgi:AcrR family transcriptional regulator
LSSQNPPATKRRLKGPERRAIIDCAAAEILARRGYDAASLEEIAEAAGISRTVIYDHYPSKRDLHIALCRKHGAELLRFMAERTPAEAPSLVRLRAGINAVFEFIENDPYAWRLMFRESATDPDVAAAGQDMQRQTTEAIAALVASDPAAQPLLKERGPETAIRVAEVIKTSVNGLASWWYDHPEFPRERLVNELVEMLWLGFERLAAGERLAAA